MFKKPCFDRHSAYVAFPLIFTLTFRLKFVNDLYIDMFYVHALSRSLTALTKYQWKKTRSFLFNFTVFLLTFLKFIITSRIFYNIVYLISIQNILLHISLLQCVQSKHCGIFREGGGYWIRFKVYGV